jgi:excisionase family DNA binding protein
MASANFYSVEEAAAELGFSGQTIRNRIADGSLFAIQSAKRGAFRIPARALEAYRAGLGKSPKPNLELLPTRKSVTVSAQEYYQQVIAPALAKTGAEDMPALLRRIEGDPSLYEGFADLVSAYDNYLRDMAAQSAQAPQELAKV